MTAKHTPGPWEHLGQGDIVGTENDPLNQCVGSVDVCSVYLRTVMGRTEANARLIAAAPELLNALIMVLDDPNALDGRPRTYEIVCKAIVKATGQNA